MSLSRTSCAFGFMPFIITSKIPCGRLQKVAIGIKCACVCSLCWGRGKAWSMSFLSILWCMIHRKIEPKFDYKVTMKNNNFGSLLELCVEIWQFPQTVVEFWLSRSFLKNDFSILSLYIVNWRTKKVGVGLFSLIICVSAYSVMVVQMYLILIELSRTVF
jgi:hypothetical protein